MRACMHTRGEKTRCTYTRKTFGNAKSRTTSLFLSFFFIFSPLLYFPVVAFHSTKVYSSGVLYGVVDSPPSFLHLFFIGCWPPYRLSFFLLLFLSLLLLFFHLFSCTQTPETFFPRPCITRSFSLSFFLSLSNSSLRVFFQSSSKPSLSSSPLLKKLCLLSSSTSSPARHLLFFSSLLSP